MAKRIGKCINYATCELAYRNSDIETEKNFVCPECGQPLREVAGRAVESEKTSLWALIFKGSLLGLLLLAGGGTFVVIKLYDGDVKKAFFAVKSILQPEQPEQPQQPQQPPTPPPPPTLPNRSSDEIEARLKAGDKAFAASRLEDALREFVAAEALDPGNPKALAGRARAQEAINKLAIDTLLKKASEARVTNRLPDAQSAYKQVLDLDPNNKVASAGLADLERAIKLEAFRKTALEARASGAKEAERSAWNELLRIEADNTEAKSALALLDKKAPQLLDFGLDDPSNKLITAWQNAGFPKGSYGPRVTAVKTASPAYLAGLRLDDMILEINGRPVRNVDEAIRIEGTLGNVRSVILNVLVPPNTREVLVSAPAGQSIELFAGIDVSDVAKSDEKEFGISRKSGAVVLKVDPDSPSYLAGLRRGDLISHIDGSSVYNADRAIELSQRLQRAKATSAKLTIIAFPHSRSIKVEAQP